METRVIKFRVWDLKYSDFSEEPFHRILLAKDGQIYNGENDDWTKHGERYIIQFFTGLLDKAGKEIYEGDIIDVQYNRLGNQLVFWDNRGMWSVSRFDITKCKIVGNQFENPKLLTQN